MQNEYQITGNHFKDWFTRAGVGGYYFFNWQVYMPCQPWQTNCLYFVTLDEILWEREREISSRMIKSSSKRVSERVTRMIKSRQSEWDHAYMDVGDRGSIINSATTAAAAVA